MTACARRSISIQSELLWQPCMATLHFDLNDTDNEPSDEQLAALMDAVAEEARRTWKVAREKLYEELRQAIRDALESDLGRH